jgi:hypothetical protein
MTFGDVFENLISNNFLYFIINENITFGRSNKK